MSTTQNLTLLTDLYELTMMQGYLKNPVQETVIFDVFYRNNPCGNGFAIAAGLDQMNSWHIWQIFISVVIFMQFRKEQLYFRESHW